MAKKKNYYSYFNYWETSSETLSNLLNLDHTEGEARPGFEPRAQKINQHAEMKSTRANKYRIKGNHVVLLFI